MGKLKNGIFGGFTGKVGNLIGSSWRGTDYIRSLPLKRQKKCSQAQLEQQARFGLMTKFLSGFNDLFAISFRNYSGRITGTNAALSFNLTKGIKGVYPNYELNYPLILVSHGNLPNANQASAKAGEAGKVDFSWNNNAGEGQAKGSDFVILVIYNPLTRQVSYTLQGAIRDNGTASFYISSNRGCAVETWIACMSSNTKYLSDSIYTGRVTTT